MKIGQLKPGLLATEAQHELFTVNSVLCLGLADVRQSTLGGALEWLNYKVELVNAVRRFVGLDEIPLFTKLEMPAVLGFRRKVEVQSEVFVPLTEKQVARFKSVVTYLQGEVDGLTKHPEARKSTICFRVISLQGTLSIVPNPDTLTENQALEWLNPLLSAAANIRLEIEPTARIMCPQQKL